MQGGHSRMLLAFCLATVASSLSFDLEDTKKRPTTKVVELLKGMSKQLEEEAKADEDTYDKFKCWCYENTEAKKKASELAMAQTKDLQDRVQVLAAKIERLTSEITTVEDEVAKNKAAFDTAKALRQQQNKEYFSDVSRIESDLKGVKDAEASFNNSGAFLQVDKTKVAKPLIQQILQKHHDKLSEDSREMLEVFLQQEKSDGIDTVLGVLVGLEDDFSADLEKLAEDEKNQVQQYQALSTAKQAEIVAGTRQIESKTEERAEAKEERAHKKLEISDVENSMGVDAGFAEEVKKQCADMDAQWDERQKTRGEEQIAISKAIETLNSDEAHAHFAKTLSFLQENSQESSVQRKLAADALSDAGKKSGDIRLVTLAMQAKIDKFTNVKKAMDDMAAAIKKQIADDAGQKDFCAESFRDNQLATEDKTRQKAALTAKEGAINIKKPTDERQALENEKLELKKQLQLASQNREAENKEFQKIIPEQRQTQVLLKQALDILGQFYSKGALVQLHSQANPEAPEGFKDYKTNGQSFGVMSMIQTLIDQTAAAEAEATRAEASAQKAYESFAKGTADSVAMKDKAIADKTAEIARLEQTLVQTRKARQGMEAELSDLANSAADLHESCDFLLTNFDKRQAAMTEEIDSIEKAKAILSGASFAEIQLS
eukprot:TRINITY_DN5335_c0_g2_i1.p1 TRINITY_DN5335_c0_g2~~TRINITY_DN5335_c0_g2_i1.p1  ORF type:complete len:660 (-),score=201.71 TRINITY_DN5335_c0_g2_i1:87-2066(-)